MADFDFSIYDSSGRVHKEVFIITTAVLLVICFISSLARFYIRIVLQHQFTIDDFFLVLGVCCIICSVGTVYPVLDGLYLGMAMMFGGPEVLATVPPDWLQITFHYHNLVTSSGMLAWAAIVCVKMSFLFFFKKLIDRIHVMLVYWRIVLAITTITSLYGFTTPFLTCPHFNNIKILTCVQGSTSKRAIDFAISQMILDVLTDFCILVIPIHVIWKIRLDWRKKAVLSLSLCLTVVVVVTTIVRKAGLHYGKGIDATWEQFWFIVSAEIGLTMVAASTFRTFFIALHDNKYGNAGRSSQGDTLERLFARIRTKTSFADVKESGGPTTLAKPGSHISGISSFAQGREVTNKYQATNSGRDDIWPLGDLERGDNGIRVQHANWSTSEQVREPVA